MVLDQRSTAERPLIRNIETAVAALAEAAAHAGHFANERLADIERDQNRQLAEISAEAERRLADIRAGYAQEVDTARRALRRIEEGGGLWTAPWDSPVWTTYAAPATVPALVRFGRLTLSAEEGIATPALLPFIGGRNVIIKVSGDGKQKAADLVQGLLLRLLATVPPAKLRLLLVDPVGLGQNVAAFMGLTEYMEELVTSKAWTEPGQIETRLADVSNHMEMVIQKYLRNRYESMEQYNAEAGEVAEPYRTLGIVNFPFHFTDQAARRLIGIATNGPRCGVYSFITVDTEQRLPHGFNLEDLERTGTVLVWQDSRFIWQDSDFRATRFELDPLPSPERFETLVNAIGAAAREASRVELPFSRIAPVGRWIGDSREGLSVPIGRAGARKIQLFELGKGTAVHALVAGRTGSGKSTLLHILTLSLALTYPPDELELYLVDFKKGVEFKEYAPRDDGTVVMPHARVIAIESEREFGLSCLEALNDELQRRGEMFRHAGANSFSEYRDKTGRKLPRILLLIDEFHEFFSEDDTVAQQAALLLDRLARQGRAFGVHMVLGSQSLAGHNLARSTLDQMAVRIALQCSEADSRLILSDHNPAARLLSRPGEAIYNSASGLEEGNVLFQIAWLADKEMTERLADLTRLAAAMPVSPPRPIVFEGNRPSRVEENHALHAALDTLPERRRAVSAWLGQPVAIKDPIAAHFTGQGGRHLLIVGRDESAAVGMLASGIVSLAAQYQPGEAEFVVVDQLTRDTDWGELPALLERILPHRVRVLQRRGLLDVLAELAKTVGERVDASRSRPTRSTFLVGMGLHRVRELRRDEVLDFSFTRSEERRPSSCEHLATILREGSEVGIHVLAWWDSYQTLSRAVDRRSLADFGVRVALPMSAEDSGHLLDTRDASRLGPHRALFVDEERPSQIHKFIPYGPPGLTWLETAGTRLRRRDERAVT